VTHGGDLDMAQPLSAFLMTKADQYTIPEMLQARFRTSASLPAGCPRCKHIQRVEQLCVRRSEFQFCAIRIACIA
jgi:hypothetical protein